MGINKLRLVKKLHSKKLYELTTANGKILALAAIIIVAIILNVCFDAKIKKINSERATATENTQPQIVEKIAAGYDEELLERNGANCSDAQEDSVYSIDNKYYSLVKRGLTTFCDQSEENDDFGLTITKVIKTLPDYKVFTAEFGRSSDRIFVIDTKNNVLKHISLSDFPNKDLYKSDVDDKYNFYLHEYNNLASVNTSEDNTKIIIGAGDCIKCATLLNNYILNLETMELIYIGKANNTAVWEDNSTVKWADNESTDATFKYLHIN